MDGIVEDERVAQTAGSPSAIAPTAPSAPKNGRSAVQKKPSPDGGQGSLQRLLEARGASGGSSAAATRSSWWMVPPRMAAAMYGWQLKNPRCRRSASSWRSGSG